MRLVSLGIGAAGIGLMAYAFAFFDTSVSTFMGQRVVNLDLQQRQTMMLMIGGLTVLVGVILYGIDLIRPQEPAKPATPAAPKVFEPKVDLAGELARQRAALDASIARKQGASK